MPAGLDSWARPPGSREAEPLELGRGRRCERGGHTLASRGGANGRQQ